MRKKWIEISDSAIRHVWRRRNCCTNSVADGEALAKVPPTQYEEDGIPVCEYCGSDYSYVRTELRIP